MSAAASRHEPIVWNKSENGSDQGDEEGEEEGRISGEQLEKEPSREQQLPPEQVPKREEGEQQNDEEHSGRNHDGETGKSLDHNREDYRDWDRSPEHSPRRDRHPRLADGPPIRQPHDRRVNGSGSGRFYSPRGFSRGRGGGYYPRRFRSRSPMRRSRSRSPVFRRQFPPSSFGPFRGPRARSPPPPPPPPPYARGGYRGRGRSMYSRDYVFSRSRGSEYDRGMPHDRYGMDPQDRFGSRGYRDRGMEYPPYRGSSRGFDTWNGDDRHRRSVDYQRNYSPPREFRRGRLEEFYDGRRRQAELERQSRPSSRPDLEPEDGRDVKKTDNVKEGYADSWGEDNRSETWNFDKFSKEWYYMDPQGSTQGPCSIEQFKQWLENMKKDDKLLSEYEKFKSVTVWKEGLDKRIPLMLLLRNNKA